MIRCRLVTAMGQFVAVVEVLDMSRGHQPGLVCWGERLFAFNRHDGMYWEEVPVVSLTPSPGLPDELPDEVL